MITKLYRPFETFFKQEAAGGILLLVCACVAMIWANSGASAFLIMPVFALANAGVALTADMAGAFGNPVTLGIIFGLVVGKQLGVSVFAGLAVRFNLAELPEGVSWGQIYGVSILTGIGFTMSLFVANLAFDGDPGILDDAKMGIIAVSLLAGIVGWVVLIRESKKK